MSETEITLLLVCCLLYIIIIFYMSSISFQVMFVLLFNELAVLCLNSSMGLNDLHFH